MGDALLPVERPMTEDKAGWGLVPGLQEPLLRIHTAADAPWAAPTTAGLGWAGLGWAGLGWAGLGWAGCAGARLHTAARREEESHSSQTSLGSQGKGNTFRVAPR